MMRDSSPAHRDPVAQRPAYLAIAILLITFATFGRCVRYPFLNWDDRYHVIDNLQLENARWFWANPFGNLYCPLTYTLFAGEIKLTQAIQSPVSFENLSPVAFHLLQIAFHSGSAVIVFLILLRLFPSKIAGALCGAVVFALHPIQVESVAWISETRGILAGFFSIAAILLLLRSRWIFASAIVALAMLSKPSAVCTPLVAITLVGFIPRETRRAFLVALVPWFVFAGAMVLMTRAVQNAAEVPIEVAWYQRPIVAVDAIGFYLWKLIVPIHLAADYGRTPDAVLHSGVARWIWIFTLAIFVLLIVRKRDRATVASIGVFVAALAPVLGLATFHYQVISTVADRYAYLAMLGVAIAITAFVPWRVAAIVCIPLAILSFAQTGNWKSDESLWSHASNINPHDAVALNNLGFAQYQNGKLDDAIATYRRALANDSLLKPAATNLDDALADQSLRDSHEEHSVIDWIRLGDQLTAEQEFVLAGAAYRKSLTLDPQNISAMNNFGLLRIKQGRFREAIVLLRRAMELEPNNQSTRDNFAMARKLLKS